MSLPYGPIKDNLESEEVVKFLINPPSYIICREKPSLCQSDAIFVVDRDQLKHEEDLKSDEFPWRNNGTKTTTIKVAKLKEGKSTRDVYGETCRESGGV